MQGSSGGQLAGWHLSHRAADLLLSRLTIVNHSDRLAAASGWNRPSRTGRYRATPAHRQVSKVNCNWQSQFTRGLVSRSLFPFLKRENTPCVETCLRMVLGRFLSRDYFNKNQFFISLSTQPYPRNSVVLRCLFIQGSAEQWSLSCVKRSSAAVPGNLP